MTSPAQPHRATDATTWRRFTHAERGGVQMLFAFSVIPLCLAVGLAIDFGRAANLRQKLQSAADNAVLAAVASAANGSALDAATGDGIHMWSASLVNVATQGNSVAAPSIVTSNNGGTFTATSTFTASSQTSVGQLIGISALPVGGTAVAQSYATTSITAGYSGSGSAWGDPHISGADGKDFIVSCPAPNWYNLLSDSGLEVNVSCYMDTTWKFEMINQLSVVLGAHQISYAIPQCDPSSKQPLTPYTAGLFHIDGIDMNPPYGATTSYLGGSVSFDFKASDWADSKLNTLLITTPQYSVKIQLTSDGGGAVNITATGAGLCGVPGGIWGKTLAGIDDSTSGDFQVGGPADTAPEFQRSTCSVASRGPHLVQ